MRYAKYMTVAAVACILSLGVVTATPHVFGTPTVEVTRSNVVATTTETVERALQQVHFPVKQPRSLPFDVAATSAFVRELPAGVQAVEVMYTSSHASRTQDHQPTYVSVTTINTPGVVQDVSSYPLTQVTLANGLRANYLNNEATQILSWSDQQQSYAIFAGKPDGAFTPADLMKIAESLR
jgi:hypothetical protein